MELHKNANLELPVCRPYTDDPNDGIVWVPYPRSNQIQCIEKPALLRCVATELADLAEISVNHWRLFAGGAINMTVDCLWRETNKLYNHLRQWYENLPDFLRVDDNAVPQVLFLQ